LLTAAVSCGVEGPPASGASTIGSLSWSSTTKPTPVPVRSYFFQLQK
jgi:hypothetical protein